MKFALLTAQLLLCCVALGMLWLMWRRERRTKRLQDALLNELLPGLAPQHRWFRINLARPPFFARRMRVAGFEAKGLLIDQGEQMRIVAVQPNGQRLQWLLPKTPQNIRWKGNVGLRSANLHWLELGTGADVFLVTADTGLNALPSREATADLMRMLLPQQPLDASALSDFALERNPATLSLVVACLALLVLSLIDITLSAHQLLQPRGLYAIGFLSASAGLLVYPLLVRRKVPGREATALCGLLVVALGIAAPAAVLRLDQWLSGGAVATPYRLVGGARLQPVEPGPPDVTLSNVREYWNQFEPGSVHNLDIVHGPLGLWQLDRSRLNALTRDWYRREDAATPAASHPASTAPAPPR
jgi:hypothetical protein